MIVSLAWFVVIAIVVISLFAALGPSRMVLPLLRASTSDWFILPLAAVVVFAVIAI